MPLGCIFGPMSFLQVTGISKREEKGWVVKDVSFSQREHQKIAIAGETGSGKSTLLKMVAGLVQPDTGSIFFEKEKVFGPAEQLVAGHERIAYLSQQHELPEFLRVEQVLRYANTLDAQDAEQLFEVCRISHLLKRRTDQLSGGEKQRIALARLLLTSPGLLLLDEPFSNLDPLHKNVLKTTIQEVGETLGITCILISHDPQDTLSWADHLLIMRQGEIIQQGSPQQVYYEPKDEYVAGLFGKYNLVPAELLQGIVSDSQANSLFLRPEQLTILRDGRSGLRGTIVGKVFYGAYYEVEVLLKGASQPILVRTDNAQLLPGAELFLSLTADSFWFLSSDVV